MRREVLNRDVERYPHRFVVGAERHNREAS
jgi:hypothetical protein